MLQQAFQSSVSWAVVLLVAIFVPAAVSAPIVTRITPQAVSPGKTTSVRFYGKAVNGAVKLLTSFPATIKLVGIEGNSADKTKQSVITFQITVPKETPAGVAAAWIIDTTGISKPVFFTVDELSTAVDNGNNHDIAHAQPMSLPLAIDGECESKQSDYYQFQAKAGDQVSIEVIAGRIGSALDPVLRLLDAQDQELVFVDDDVSFGADCRTVVTIPADGTYIVELRDVRYRGGGRYRLRLGDFSIRPTSFPFGNNLANREIEPNDQANEATRIRFPCVIEGMLNQTGDRDIYGFSAEKNETFSLKTISRSAGSPAALYLHVTGPDGNVVAQTSNADSEKRVFITIPKQGQYLLTVEDVIGRGGADFAYRLDVTRGGMFSLRVKNDKKLKGPFSTTPGGAVTIPIECERTGFDGPVVLSAHWNDQACTVHQNTIDGKEKSIRLLIDVPASWQPGDGGVLRLQGTALVAGQERNIVVSTVDVIRQQTPQLFPVPRWLDGCVAIGVRQNHEK